MESYVLQFIKTYMNEAYLYFIFVKLILKYTYNIMHFSKMRYINLG